MDNMSEIDISGLDKAEVLAALHNATHPLGMGLLHAIDTCSVERARKDIKDRGADLYFDYYYGRPIKTDLRGTVLRTAMFNRDAGPGAAERAISALRK